RILAQRLERNLRLERRIKLLACLRHFSLHRLRQSRSFHTLANGPKSGVQFRLRLSVSRDGAKFLSRSDCQNWTVRTGPCPSSMAQHDSAPRPQLKDAAAR